MSSGMDAFARFVAALSQALDDHETTGADLAAQVHLSRFHFDRLVARVSGEPPATFRRRVLLERAAYRLLTTRQTVLDVAVEAGYSSHEAFTRAFVRAYGAPPARWRRRPTQLKIEAPSGVHFYPPGGLQLPAQRKVSPVDLLMKMVEHHVWLVGQLLTHAARLDDERLDSPIEISVQGIDDDPTLRSLLSRLVGQLDMWSTSVAGRQYDFAVEHAEPVAQMHARLTHAGPAYLSFVREACENGKLDETFINALCDPHEVFTYGGVIAHVRTFAAHRRTLAIGALYDAGIADLGSDDPMRWLGKYA